MLAVLSDDGELLAIVHRRADIEPALRARFWHLEVQYAEDRANGIGAVGEHGYSWAGLDLADEHWTIWSTYDGPSEVDRWVYLQGTVREAPVWGPASGGVLQQGGAIQIMLTGSGGAPPPDPGIAAYALQRGLEEGYAAGLRRRRRGR